MTEPRDEARGWFLRVAPGSAIEPMAGDASSRRFVRLVLPDGATRIGVDYGRPFEGETDDVRMSRLFLEAGLPVARVLAVGPDPGCLLMEDLGRVTLWDEVRRRGTTGDPRIAVLYGRAVRLAARVAVRGTPVLARSSRRDGPVLDAGRFRFEMDFFLEHYIGGLLGRRPERELRRALGRLADLAAETPGPVLCHRDFHSRNLVVAGDGSLGMVDIQDARWGPDTYDLASLVRDAYVELSEEEVRALVAAYLEHLEPAGGGGAFRERLEVVALQRMIKALGTFGYQVTVRGAAAYLEAVPGTLRRIGAALEAREPVAGLRAAWTASGAADPPPGKG
jgi:aminoglycoside/choline kinase family phosphotransferase